MHMPLYSPGTGLLYPAENASELFEAVVSELLTKAICWDSVIDGFVDHVKSDAPSKVSISGFGNSVPLKDLVTALTKAVPETEVSIDDFVAWVFKGSKADSQPRSPAQSKLAIVGMSCRLPGGATVSSVNFNLFVTYVDIGTM